MFGDCYSLTSLPDISKWNTRNVIDMSSLFYNCRSLISLPRIEKWNFQNIDDISYMFYGCHSLISLPDITKWNRIKYGRHIFSDCISLYSEIFPSIFKN